MGSYKARALLPSENFLASNMAREAAPPAEKQKIRRKYSILY